MTDRDSRSLPPRPKSTRYEGKNVHRGHILPRGEWVNEYGSKFTPTGVHWSADESRMHERFTRMSAGLHVEGVGK
jgi:hypothetical protein